MGRLRPPHLFPRATYNHNREILFSSFQDLRPVGFVLLLSACDRIRSRENGITQSPVILISVDTLRADRLPIYGSKGSPSMDRLAADGIVCRQCLLARAADVAVARHHDDRPPAVRQRRAQQHRLPRFVRRELRCREFLNAAMRPAARSPLTCCVPIPASVRCSTSTTIRSRSVRPRRSAPYSVTATTRSARRSAGSTTSATSRFFSFFISSSRIRRTSRAPLRTRYADSYDGEVATVDAILGSLPAELERRGLYDDSLIVLTSDHGEGLGDHGEAEHGVLLYREVLHVPLIVKLPARHLAGKRVTAPAQLVDLFPTIVAATGADVPAGLPGMSLVTSRRVAAAQIARFTARRSIRVCTSDGASCARSPTRSITTSRVRSRSCSTSSLIRPRRRSAGESPPRIVRAGRRVPARSVEPCRSGECGSGGACAVNGTRLSGRPRRRCRACAIRAITSRCSRTCSVRSRSIRRAATRRASLFAARFCAIIRTWSTSTCSSPATSAISAVSPKHSRRITKRCAVRRSSSTPLQSRSPNWSSTSETWSPRLCTPSNPCNSIRQKRTDSRCRVDGSRRTGSSGTGGTRWRWIGETARASRH